MTQKEPHRSDPSAEIADLRQRLAVAEASLQAALSGQVDAVMDPSSGEAVLLKQAQEALRMSEERHRKIIETTMEGVWVINESAKILFANERMAKLLKTAPEDMIGKSLYDFIDSDDRGQADEKFKIRRTGVAEVFDFRFRRHDGTFMWASLSINSIDWENRFEALLAMVTDISDRKKVEDEMKRLAAIVEFSEDAIYSKTLDKVILSWNPGAERLFGYAAAEVIGRSSTMLNFPETEAKYEDMIRRVASGESVLHFEVARRRKDGSRVEVSMGLSPIRDPTGAVTGISAIARDISERVELEGRYRQSQKMEAVGRLAGGIAHDFNNLLTIILGSCDFILSDSRLKRPHPVLEEILEIKKAGARAADLTRRLLLFSRKNVTSPRVISLSNVVLDMEGMLKRILGEDIHLIIKADASMGLIVADPSQFEQVVLNLAVNARDAMPRGGSLLIEVSHVEMREAGLDMSGGQPPGAYVQLAMTDTGEGMSPDVKAHLFEPFFTTKEQGRGTGLGLATVYGIVSNVNGDIRVYSEKGIGTTVKVFVPKSREHLKEQNEISSVPQKEISGGRESILLVEDEDGVRNLTRRILQRHGYSIQVAETPEAALTLLSQPQAEYQLMITDVVMPTMHGPDLAKRVLTRCPKMKILFMSGYTEHAALVSGLIDGSTTLLQKPFSAEDLLSAVRKILDTPS